MGGAVEPLGLAGLGAGFLAGLVAGAPVVDEVMRGLEPAAGFVACVPDASGFSAGVLVGDESAGAAMEDAAGFFLTEPA